MELLAVYRKRSLRYSEGMNLTWTLLCCAAVSLCAMPAIGAEAEEDGAGALPPPRLEGDVSLESAIAGRRSVRRYADRGLSLEALGQLCWSAQGITDSRRALRAAPSAGATYPLELYVATADGVFKYAPADHQLTRHHDEDIRSALRDAALGQRTLEEAPAVFIISGDVQRTAQRYGPRAERYMWMEVGHAAQNLLLQAEALGLVAVPIGAFRDQRTHRAAHLPDREQALYLIPVGHPVADTD